MTSKIDLLVIDLLNEFFEKGIYQYEGAIDSLVPWLIAGLARDNVDMDTVRTELAKLFVRLADQGSFLHELIDEAVEYEETL